MISAQAVQLTDEEDRARGLEGLLSRRAILVTGKGGVGKTTFAAALAHLAAWTGKRVLVAEVASDGKEPSPITQALGGDRSGEEPVKLGRGIRSVLLTPATGHHRFLQDTLPVRLIADAAMRSTAIRRFLTAAPAFAEMGVLYRMLDLVRRRRGDGTYEHEICIVDCPATGHVLAITQLPEVILKVIPGGPIGAAVREGLALLGDPALTATLVVTLPETLPVSEAIELTAGLSRNKVPIFSAIANRMPLDPFSAEERSHVDRLNEAKGPLFGTRAIRRIDTARTAVARLRRGLDLPVFTVPEINERGARVPAAVARVLAASLPRLGAGGRGEAAS